MAINRATSFKHVWIAVAIFRDDPDDVFWHGIGNDAEEASADLLAQIKMLLQERIDDGEVEERRTATDDDAQAWADDNFMCPEPFEVKVPLG